jgi:hypothetical protein
MNKNGNIKKWIAVAALILWSAIVLSAFYITQRPLAFQVLGGAAATLWSITLTIILLLSSTSLGYFILLRIHPQLQPHEKSILGTGMGLGILGLAGFGLGAAGLASVPVLIVLLTAVLIYAVSAKVHLNAISDLQSLIDTFRKDAGEIPTWLPFAVLMAGLVSFFFALLPPADGFDGLLYHLRLPEQLLQNGGLRAYNNFPFWFPSLVEGDYVWALALGSERTAQLIHWSFFMLVIGMIWNWSRQVFEVRAAWWALAVLISMPSLPWLASWAYTDFALTFFVLASLYSLWRWNETSEGPWLFISGLFAGLAMGVKYTSFILPLICVIFILFRELNMKARILPAIKFSLPAVVIASPWYIRNWLMMGNPFYPFVFGGRYWDAFLVDWYSGIGTGIGWDIREIVLLPFTITLGHRDQTFYDGRIGPLFLLFLPLVLWMFWTKRSAPSAQRSTLLIISTFTLINYLFWVFSVTQTMHLWQSRLLFPALIAFTIPMGTAIASLSQLNLPRLRPAFIIHNLIGMVIFISLLDNSLSLIARRPLASILGIESRAAYFERIQPAYSRALDLVNTTPEDAFIYFLFEPRSYNMPRNVQADPMNSNLMHDLYLFGDAAIVAKNWKASGYTHLLVYLPSMDEQFSEAFDPILPYLKPAGENESYKLYLIKP